MKDTIIRAPLKDGNFATIRRECLFDPRLKEPGFRLLVLMLNNSEDWEIYTTYYQQELGWSPGKMSKAKKELISLGYLKEETEGVGKGMMYRYHVDETKFPTADEAKKYLKSKNRKLDSKNRKSETEVRNSEANNTNTDNINPEKKNKKENNKTKCSVSVEVPVEPMSYSVPKVEDKTPEPITHDTTLQLKKEDFFFDYGERPSDVRVIAYVNGVKGYSKGVALQIYRELHASNFKNKDGNRIMGIQRYIDVKLEDFGAPGENDNTDLDIDEFLQSTNNLHKYYMTKAIEANKDVDYTTGMLNLKDAARQYHKSLPGGLTGYMNYIKEYIEINGYTSPAAFKAYVTKHQERLLKGTGTNYFNRGN